jgi:hypothetical protein
MCEEIPLSGGRITQGVVRKGNYVLRPCCANSAFVHTVLMWLENKNVSISTRFIGLTDDGREITSFLEGISPDNLGDFNDDQLFEAGNIIKKLHFALSDFPGCLNGQTVCHNDLSPCNFMFRNGLPYAVFDWDAAEIADPINDVAYAVWLWCDIGNNDISPAAIGKKIKIILDAYELCMKKRHSFITEVLKQMQRTASSLQVAKRVDAYNWANRCIYWLNIYENQIVSHYTK